MPSRLAGLLLVLVTTGSCGHGEPFGSSGNDVDGPRLPGTPARLTDNPGVDSSPSWLPDGSAILYTFETNPSRNLDRCLALLPPHGGARIREICNTSVGHLDSTETYGPSAVSDSGKLAYVYTQAKPGRPVPNHHQLRVATLADPQAFTVVHPIPFSVDGFKIDAVLDLHWVSERRLVYLGLFGIPNTLNDDTIVVLVDLGPPISTAVVSGTVSVASLSAGADPDAIAFTRGGDARVHQLVLANGDQSVLYDFSPGFPGAISVSPPRLVTVLGRTLLTIDLTTGACDTLVGATAGPALGNPSVSLAGAVVAEGGQDLWLFEAPSQ